MEQVQRRTKKKKDKKPLYILLGFLVFFGVFIYLITRPSTQNKAIEQVQVCSNVNDVKSLYERYKFDLLETDENGNKIVAIEFQDAVRDKLNKFNLNEEDLIKCLEWIPPSKTSLNVIVIPDLSKRITDTLNNPNQINNDILVLETIWKSFVEYSKLKQDTKDKLIIDVTDIDQAKGQFGAVANKLQFDLSEHKSKSNRLFFTNEKNIQLENGIKEMYRLAKDKPLGANYEGYLRQYLNNRLKKSSLFDNYINKIIIITDGYLEYENPLNVKQIINRTKITDALRKSVLTGNILDIITSNQLNIPVVSGIDLSNSEILVCEVNERIKTGKSFDFLILKTYWEDWFKRMKVNEKNIKFIQREQANENTIKKVAEFISK